MIVDVSLTNAKFYDVQAKFDVVKGEKFIMTTDSTVPVKWFANEDIVLNLTDGETSADVVANELGSSIIQIQSADFERIRTFFVNVVSSILEPAKSLGLTADPAVPK